MTPADRLPVIAAVGECVDRPADPRKALDPIGLMAAAAQAAEADAGASLLREVDSLDVVHQVTWRYAGGTAALVCERLGIAPARAVYGVTGGESPVRYIHEAALRIARGEGAVALIVSGEAQHALNKLRAAGETPPWPPEAEAMENPISMREILSPLSRLHALVRPIDVYPLYDMGAAAGWGQTPGEARAESGALWSGMSRVAAANPSSWGKAVYTPDEVVEPTADNRLIAWPYTKRQVANPAVNMGAAVVVMSLAKARALGIAEDRLLHIWGGAAANAPRDFLARDAYTHSTHQEAVLQAAMALAPAKGGGRFDAVELYSCFPVVPKMARRTLGLGEDAGITVTGGLSFFGAPLNAYMAHAAAAMTHRLRNQPGVGLLYGQGEYVTKHHALVVANAPPPSPLAEGYGVQDPGDAAQGAVPPPAPEHEGGATVETATVIYGKDNVPAFGVVVAKTATGARTLGRVPAEDLDGLLALTSLDVSPVGRTGQLVRAGEGPSVWRFT